MCWLIVWVIGDIISVLDVQENMSFVRIDRVLLIMASIGIVV